MGESGICFDKSDHISLSREGWLGLLAKERNFKSALQANIFKLSGLKVWKFHSTWNVFK